MSFLRAYYKTKNTGTRNDGTRNIRGTTEQWNTTRTPEHRTPAERRNKTGITEHHRNNGTPSEQWKQRGTAEQ